MAPQPLPDLPESAKRSNRAESALDSDKLKKIAEGVEEVRRVAEAAIKNGK